MNNLLDLVNTWANKLTYRIMKNSGASQEALDKFLQASKDKTEDVIKADKELSNRVQSARITTYILMVLGGFIAYKILTDRR